MITTLNTSPIAPRPIELQPSTPTHIDVPQMPIDPTNPLAWVLVMSVLLSNTDEVVNAIANLVRATKDKQGKKGDRNG